MGAKVSLESSSCEFGCKSYLPWYLAHCVIIWLYRRCLLAGLSYQVRRDIGGGVQKSRMYLQE